MTPTPLTPTPPTSTTRPELSLRWPWLRGGLSGLVAMLLPLVWVVDTSSCGDNPGPVERTGIEVVRQLDFPWWAVAPILAATVLAPWAASRLAGLGRLAAHVVGLGVTGLVGAAVFAALFVEIFTVRTIRGAGFVVLAAGASAVGDALFRLGAGGRELWLARRAGRPVP